MTPYPFMISIQYGKGPHFFKTGAYNMQEALTIAERIYTGLPAKHKSQAAKPRVMVWELRESIQDKSLGPIVWKVQEC